MVYGTNGKWIKDIPLPGQINKPKLSLNADGTLSVIHMPFQEGEPLAFQVDMEGNIFLSTILSATGYCLNLP